MTKRKRENQEGFFVPWNKDVCGVVFEFLMPKELEITLRDPVDNAHHHTFDLLLVCRMFYDYFKTIRQRVTIIKSCLEMPISRGIVTMFPNVKIYATDWINDLRSLVFLSELTEIYFTRCNYITRKYKGKQKQVNSLKAGKRGESLISNFKKKTTPKHIAMFLNMRNWTTRRENKLQRKFQRYFVSVDEQ